MQRLLFIAGAGIVLSFFPYDAAVGVVFPLPTGYFAARANVSGLHTAESNNHPKLAAFVLAGSNCSEAVASFATSYAAFPYEMFVLHEGAAGADLFALRDIVPNVRFIDVSEYFRPELSRGVEPISCPSSMGYRLMCRFMSGPVYWLPEFASYEQLLRIDTDSRFTRALDRSLALQGDEVYAYALLDGDAPACQYGFVEFLRKAYEASPNIVRWGSAMWVAPWERTTDVSVLNCNFEVASLPLFRSKHYREYWSRVEASGLFISTRLGDHQVKTAYVETFELERNVVCYAGLPYVHPTAGEPDCRARAAFSRSYNNV